MRRGSPASALSGAGPRPSHGTWGQGPAVQYPALRRGPVVRTGQQTSDARRSGPVRSWPGPGLAWPRSRAHARPDRGQITSQGWPRLVRDGLVAAAETDQQHRVAKLTSSDAGEVPGSVAGDNPLHLSEPTSHPASSTSSGEGEHHMPAVRGHPVWVRRRVGPSTSRRRRPRPTRTSRGQQARAPRGRALLRLLRAGLRVRPTWRGERYPCGTAPVRSDWPMMKTANDDATPAMTAMTRTLAASTTGRFGMADSVARIDPVEYSALTTSTPIASWPNSSPVRLRLVGSKCSRSTAESRDHRFVSVTVARIQMAMLSPIVAPRLQAVERTLRNLVAPR